MLIVRLHFSQMGVGGGGGGITWHQPEDPNPTLPIWCQIPVETVARLENTGETRADMAAEVKGQ